MTTAHDKYFPKGSPVPPGVEYRKDVMDERKLVNEYFAGDAYLPYKSAADAKVHHGIQSQHLHGLQVALMEIVKAIAEANSQTIGKLDNIESAILRLAED